MSKAGNKCSLPHCCRSKRVYPEMKLFRFPNFDSPLFKVWAEKCHFDEEFVANFPLLFLCDKHFSSDLIGKRYLKRGAVPTLNITNNDSADIGETQKEVDLSMLKSPPRKRKRSESPISKCFNCQKNVENEAFYRKMYFNLLKKTKK